jgi:hypothetical protein
MIPKASQTGAFQKSIPNYSLKNGGAQSVFQRYRVRVEGNQSVWNDELQHRFNRITELPLGWDGYQGKPVSFACASFASKILEQLFIDGLIAPSIIPGSDGTLQIEWHKSKMDVELDVLGPNSVLAYMKDDELASNTEIEIQNDFTEVMVWLRLMTSRSLGSMVTE